MKTFLFFVKKKTLKKFNFSHKQQHKLTKKETKNKKTFLHVQHTHTHTHTDKDDANISHRV